MPRKYIRKLGARTYSDYSAENLKNALKEIREASDKYGIPLGTLSRKMHNLQTAKPGHPTVLTADEEKNIAEAILVASDWGFPFEPLDVRVFVKSYLDRAGKIVLQFSDNLPGNDWFKLFLSRHKADLKPRLCQNIKTSRAAVNPDTIAKYFDNIEKLLREISPTSFYGKFLPQTC